MRTLMLALALAGCIDFPAAPRCGMGGDPCPEPLICNPRMQLCMALPGGRQDLGPGGEGGMGGAAGEGDVGGIAGMGGEGGAAGMAGEGGMGGMGGVADMGGEGGQAGMGGVAGEGGQAGMGGVAGMGGEGGMGGEVICGPADDFDNDGHCDEVDVCPQIADDQRDTDGDRRGNACDNCPDVINPDQADADNDRRGDACDQADPCFATNQQDVLAGDDVQDLALAWNDRELLTAWTPLNRQGARVLQIQVGGRDLLPLLDLPAAPRWNGRDLTAAGGDGLFALAWIEAEGVVVRVPSLANVLSPPAVFADADQERLPVVLRVPHGWVVIWQSLGANGVIFKRADLDDEGRVMGEVFPLPMAPLVNLPFPRYHAVSRADGHLLIVWEQGGAGMPSMFIARIPERASDVTTELVRAGPGIMPTTVSLQDVAHVVWPRPEGGLLVATPTAPGVMPADLGPAEMPGIAGLRALPRAVADGRHLGVLACAAALANDECSELRYLRLTAPPGANPAFPEWIRGVRQARSMTVVSTSNGVAIGWTEANDETRRAVVVDGPLSPACRE